MIKLVWSLSMLISLIGVLHASPQVGPPGGAGAGDIGVRLTIDELPRPQRSGQPPTLRVRFKNVSKNPVTMLNVFEPIPVFFSVAIVDQVARRPVNVPGAGKVDFFGRPDVTVLQPDQEIAVPIDLGKLFGPQSTFKRGLYNVSVQYHNQYGEGVVKGVIPSNTVEIRVVDEGEQ